MKKAALLFVLAGSIFCGIPSCKKEEQHKAPISETQSVSLKTNEAYTFSLPKNKRNDKYEFITQAGHSSISSLGEDASGNPVYRYTPATDYSGTDVVVVSNAEEKGGRPEHAKPHLLPPPHRGDCDGGPEDHYIVTFNFTIENTATASR